MRGALLLVCVAVSLILAPSAFAENPVTVDDRTGDANGVPDIARVTIEDFGPGYAFLVELATMQDLRPDGLIGAFIDSDMNQSTGASGADYLVVVGADRSSITRWNGTTFERFANTPLFPVIQAGRVAFAVAKDDIATAKFAVTIISTTSSSQEADFAPDESPLVYPAATPTIDRWMIPATALLPRAGKVLDARGVKVMMSTGDVVAPALTCKLTYRARVIKPLRGGCRWKIPKSLRGKTLSLTLTATAGGVTAVQTFPVKVGR